MKTHILTALWKRPEITRICFEGIKRLGLEATAAISEESYIPVCEEYGINYVMTPNNPLGDKWNTGMEEALKREWDYVMILGSDDIVSSTLLEHYTPLMGRYFMFGVDSCYFYHKGEIKYYNSKSGMSIGAGRMLHRVLVEDCMPLWPSINRSLDGGCIRRIHEKGYSEYVLSLEDALIMDIKSETNLNHYKHFKGEPASNNILTRFSYTERQLLKNI